MYNSKDSMMEEKESAPIKASKNTSEGTPDTITTLNSLYQLASDAKGITEDETLINAHPIVLERIIAVKDAHSHAPDK